MRTRSRWVAILGAGLVFAPLAGLGQAITVAPSGAMTQGQPAPAIPPEDRASKEQLAKLFEVMRIKDQMVSMRRIVPMMVESQMREQLKTMSAQVADGSKTTADQRAAINRILRKYVDQAVNLYPIDEMINDMTGLYQTHLSREDVDAMISFYSSPAGQHLLDAQPKIAQEYMPLVMRRAQERTKTLTAEMMKDLAALKQPAKPTPPATNK